MATEQPMSDARLDAIREQLQMLMSGIAELDSERDSSLLMLHSGLDDVERLPVGSTLDVTRIYAANIHDLLADNERLRAREAAWLEVVQAVAEGQPVSIDEDLWGIRLVSLRQSDVERFHQMASNALAASGQS